jgi:hypothetical protein
MDTLNPALILHDGTRIEVQDILRLESEVFDGLPEDEG